MKETMANFAWYSLTWMSWVNMPWKLSHDKKFFWPLRCMPLELKFFLNCWMIITIEWKKSLSSKWSLFFFLNEKLDKRQCLHLHVRLGSYSCPVSSRSHACVRIWSALLYLAKIRNHLLSTECSLKWNLMVHLGRLEVSFIMAYI